MGFWTSLAFLTGACVVLHKERSRQTSLVRSILIHAPAGSVFEVLGNIENIPEWYRRAAGAAALFSLTRLSLWGEHIPSDWRLETQDGGNSNEIRIRWMQDREFVYSCHDPKGVSYDCIFRIAAKDRDCTLTWELRYTNRRWLDAAFNRTVTVKDILQAMGKSLDTIRRLAENRVAQRNRRAAELAWSAPRSLAS